MPFAAEASAVTQPAVSNNFLSMGVHACACARGEDFPREPIMLALDFVGSNAQGRGPIGFVAATNLAHR